MPHVRVVAKTLVSAVPQGYIEQGKTSTWKRAMQSGETVPGGPRQSPLRLPAPCSLEFWTAKRWPGSGLSGNSRTMDLQHRHAEGQNMIDSLPPESHRWMSRAFHGAILVALLIAIGFRVYGYFATPASEQSALDSQATSSGNANLTEIAATAFQRQDWKRTSEAYQELAEREPQNVRNCTRLAYSLYASQQYDPALAAFLRCCRFQGDVRRWSLYNIACVYALEGEKRLALDYLGEAADAGYRTRQSISEDPDLKSLLGDPEFEKLAELVKPIALRNVYRRFDFLVGHWNMMGDQGQRVGSLDLEQVSAGYALRGECIDDTRSTTRSIFAFYDPEIGNWKQIWLDVRGNIIHLQGIQSEGESFILEGYLTTADGQRKTARLTCREQEHGVVHLLLALTPDAGVTWEPLLDVTLITKKRAKDFNLNVEQGESTTPTSSAGGPPG